MTDRLMREFGDQASAAALVLAEYGKQPYEREGPRVRAAILDLASGDLAQLRHFTDCARADYRDVLMWAEYPDQLEPVDTERLLRRFGEGR